MLLLLVVVVVLVAVLLLLLVVLLVLLLLLLLLVVVVVVVVVHCALCIVRAAHARRHRINHTVADTRKAHYNSNSRNNTHARKER